METPIRMIKEIKKMTHPSKEEVEQDNKQIRRVIFSWEFVIALFTTLVIYKIIDMVILYMRVKFGK